VSEYGMGVFCCGFCLLDLQSSENQVDVKTKSKKRYDYKK
jgi:hypothetical protein